MEKREFVYGVDEVPSWFKNYVEKIEVNHRGIKVCYVYCHYDKDNCKAKVFNVNDIVRYEDLYDLW